MALRLWRKRYRTKEIAEMMGLKLSAASMLIHRAKVALAERGIDLDDWISCEEVFHE
jgi:DNA-directed RNA polymerase specialized sigma24 family protein